MNLVLALGLALVVITATGCSAAREPPTVVYPERVELNDGSRWPAEGEKTNVRPSRETFIVSWELHGGYQLWPGTYLLSNPVIPDFETDEVRRVFDAVEANLGAYVGKRIYCDGTGVRYERNGMEYFLVREARVIAQ